MKLLLSFLLSCILLTSCHSDKSAHQGPLSKMPDFEVYTLFSPYEKFDHDQLFNNLVDDLKEVGHVEFIDSTIFNSTSQSPVLLISIGGFEQESMGRIEVFASVEVQANAFKTACSIWHLNASEINENLPYPEVENGKITFKKNSSPQSASSSLENDPKTVLKEMILSFAKEYYKSNSEKPTFRVYKKG